MARAPLKSIALFAPNRSALYVNVLLGLRKAFVRRGVDVHVGWGYLEPELMAQFCSVFRPDAILEIDRTRNNAEGMPKHVLSIAWIQDWRSMEQGKIGRSTDRFGGSDLYYFCAKPESVGVDVSELSHWGYLLQATDPDIYFPGDGAIESDFSLMGYIPPRHHLARIHDPLPVELLGPPANRNVFGTIGDLIEALQREGLTWNRYDAAEARRVVNRYVYSLIEKRGNLFTRMMSHLGPFGSVDVERGRCVVPDQVMYLIENEIMRATARAAIVDQILRVSPSLRLYGVGMWQSYPEYAHLYRGPVLTEEEVRRIYCSSRINLHNAMTQMHTRALDCMACGSVIMVNKMRHNDASEPDCLRAHFEPGVHYFEYDDDLEQQARDVLANKEARARAGRLAADAVRERHTWVHRVDQILADAAQL